VNAVAAHFAQTYAEARAKFLAAASKRGLAVQSHMHPLPGHDGEALALDVVRQGPADAAAVLILSSGCHGAEGFCGSGVQNALLADEGWHAAVDASGVAVLYLHALNPHGFSWWRRVTNENVDLNRNWHDYRLPLPRNAGYDEIAAALIPPQWPEGEAARQQLAAYAEKHGAFGLQTAISAGQWDHPGGMFFGGHGPTWSRQTLELVLREHATACARLGWIDFHTGLGPRGHGERIFNGPDDKAMLARAKAWWGPVTNTFDGSSTSAPLQGVIYNAALMNCPQAEFTSIALEYGTKTVPEVMLALRADHWLHQHPAEGAPQRAAIRQQMRDAFYIDSDEWKQRIVEQGREAALQGLGGLSASVA
jgi:hypothetical protein